MFSNMRKRVNSQQSQSDTEAEPLVVNSNAPSKNEPVSLNATPPTVTAQLVLFLRKVRGYRKKEMCKLLMISLMVIVFFSFTLGLMLAKTGVSYKINGKTKVFSPQEIASSHHKDIKVSKEKSFAVVVNTFKRPDMLKSALNHWVNTCGTESNISQVFVVWAELDVVPPKPEDILSEFTPTEKLRKSASAGSKSKSKPEVEFIRVPKDSLNSRFYPIKNLKSEAVFMVDDDLRIDCQSMKTSFEAWRHYPDTLVGFYPRLASPKTNLFKSKADLIYHTWPIVYSKQKFNIILTKASFLHKKYLGLYHDEKENPKEILDYIDANMNCEDIAMAFLVARKTGPPKDTKDGYCSTCPVYTKGKIKDEGLFNGISTSGGSLAPKGHMEKRSMCLDEMTRIYKSKGWEYPLFDVNLSEQSWRHTFGWMSTPSNVFENFSVGNSLL
jgi:hypothetical protein